MMLRHGHARKKSPRHPLYVTWCQMISRCHSNKDTQNTPFYRDRGIVVCSRWRFGEDGKAGVECFIEDMGPRPYGHTLDRENNEGNYEPSNCRWATPREQLHNRRYGFIDRRSKNAGEASPNAKLTAAKVSEMRARYRAGGISQAQLSKEYGLSSGRISEILSGKAWSCVPMESDA